MPYMDNCLHGFEMNKSSEDGEEHLILMCVYCLETFSIEDLNNYINSIDKTFMDAQNILFSIGDLIGDVKTLADEVKEQCQKFESI